MYTHLVATYTGKYVANNAKHLINILFKKIQHVKHRKMHFKKLIVKLLFI